jgi:hypothetical protein
VVRLSALPRLPNGKIDRAALPVPALNPRQPEAFEEPRTSTERAVARVWQEVLGLTRVGVHDDFFMLGGHSLLATQTIARLRRTLGVPVELSAMFAKPTIAGLAARIDELAGTKHGDTGQAGRG